VLVLTMHESKELAAAVKRVGAKGYVIKSHAARDLMNAIQTIVDGGDFFTHDQNPAAPAKREDKKRAPLLRIGLSPAFARI
jgi:DNA-binding NarL/FixJ family response regulator